VLWQFKIKITKTEFMMAVPFISPSGLTITPALSAFEWRAHYQKTWGTERFDLLRKIWSRNKTILTTDARR
jgi:hypothetical protein